MARKKINDPSFYKLANNIAKILSENNGGKKITGKKFTEIQKKQVETMMSLEESFRKNINSYKQSDKIYKKFIIYIKIEKGNILKARPYFRENSKTFGKFISPAFKEESFEKLKDFHINYKFMNFVIKNWRGNLPEKVKKAWQEHGIVRQKIIENSMPLAINEAMKFYKSVPRNHVNLMDMINASIAGLAIGTDKWVGPFSTVFRSVCIGRMKSNIMELYNQTFLHYYPSDKKIIYKANLLKSREKVEDNYLLLDKINEYLKENKDKRQLDIHQLEDLLNGSSVKSIAEHTEEEEYSVYNYYYDPSNDIEKEVEKSDIIKKMIIECNKLDILEKKIIKLKGVDL